MTDETVTGGQGPATDRHNEPVIDPTANVLNLVDAAITRQDDLREEEKEHVREIFALREKLYEEETRRVQTLANLRADHANELRQQEAERINAIRAVDVEAVQRAAEVQATQQSTLANQVATSAEALRAQVAAAAQAAQIALAAALEPLQKDIADLRKSQYEAQGVRVQRSESGTSNRDTLGIAISAFSAVIALLAVISVVVIAVTK